MNIPDMGLDRWELASNGVSIRTQDDYQRAGQALVQIATIVKKLREGDTAMGWQGLDLMVSTSKAAYDTALQQRNFFMERWTKIRKVYEESIAQYRIVTEEQERRLQTNLEEATKKLRQSIDAEAKRALLSGDATTAEARLAEKELLPERPSINKQDLRLPGIAQQEEYEIEITDLIALVKAVADGVVPLAGIVLKREQNLFEVRMSVIQGYVKSMGDAFNWPGVKVTKKVSYRPRAAKE